MSLRIDKINVEWNIPLFKKYVRNFFLKLQFKLILFTTKNSLSEKRFEMNSSFSNFIKSIFVIIWAFRLKFTLNLWRFWGWILKLCCDLFQHIIQHINFLNFYGNLPLKGLEYINYFGWLLTWLNLRKIFIELMLCYLSYFGDHEKHTYYVPNDFFHPKRLENCLDNSPKSCFSVFLQITSYQFD